MLIFATGLVPGAAFDFTDARASIHPPRPESQPTPDYCHDIG
jgi:hypothetical protein